MAAARAPGAIATRARVPSLGQQRDLGTLHDQLVILHRSAGFESGVAATHQLLKLRHHPTAVFASNDDMALGALAAAQRQGLAIPGDLAIVGFDDSPASSLVWPPLTTIRQPTLEMARAAVDLLIGTPTVQGTPGTRASAALQRVLPHELVVRDSTAAPARQARRAMRG